MDERDPVDDGEFVYRRIHRSFFDPTAPIPIQFPAFRPNSNDSAGISFFRARFTLPANTLTNVASGKAAEYFVARLSVRALRKLGITVKPDPIMGGPLEALTKPLEEAEFPRIYGNGRSFVRAS